MAALPLYHNEAGVSDPLAQAAIAVNRGADIGVNSSFRGTARDLPRDAALR